MQAQYRTLVARHRARRGAEAEAASS